MALTFIKGDCSKSCFDEGVKVLKPFLKQISVPVYVVVPDRASLVTELDLIDNLGEQGILNFDVITLNKLARLILPDIDASTVGKAGMLVKIKQIINNHISDFKIYNKLAKQNCKGFVDEIYQTILQLKASNITPVDIENNLEKMPDLLAMKMNDILLVYKDYENFLTNEIFDGSSKFNSVIENIKFSTKVNNAVFWFTKSEAFTNQAIAIINELVRYSREVYVSVTNTNLTSFYKNLETVLTENAKAILKNVNIIKVENNCSLEQKFIRDNLFKFNALKQDNKYLKIIEAKNEEEELKFVASKIVSLVKSGEHKFNDFNIALANIVESEELIKSIFNEFEIPYNIDIEYNAKENVVAKFIFGAFEVLKTHFKSEKVLTFAKNALNFLELSDLCDFENYVYKYGIDGVDFSRPFNIESAETVRSYIFNLLGGQYNDFVKSQNGEEFMFLILDFLETSELESRVNRFIALLNDKNEFLEAQVTKLSYDKIVNIFNQIKIVINKDELSINNFFDILSLIINELNFNLAPVLSNAVFIGDAFESYFANREYLFICGACEKAFPRIKKDVGLIVDDEIIKLNLTNSLSPSVSEVNERYLNRAYELLYFTKNLCISYSLLKNGEKTRPSFFVELLKKLNNSFKAISEDDIELINYKEAYNYALKGYNDAIKGKICSKPELVASLVKLFDINKIKPQQDELNVNEDYLELVFNNNSISISQLETYATCPYKHFLRHALKLRKQEKSEIGSLDAGNIIHRFVELFLSNINILKVKDNLNTP